jgi:Flp pilus assembly protein TadG
VGYRRHRRKLGTDKSGAAAVEFAFITIALVLFTLGIIDVGFALYWFNRAEKATQLGVRVAAVSNPVTDFMESFSGTDGGGTAGNSCADVSGAINPTCSHPIITCSATSGAGNCTSGVFSSAAFTKIFNEMRVLYPKLSSDNVQVEYRPTPLGFVGRPGAQAGTFNLVPQVTVRIVNLQYNYIALGSLIGLAPFTLPVISASMTGEDLDHTTNL